MYKRPVLIFGAGIRLAGACDEAVAFAEASGIPVSPTWGGLDIMPHDHPLFIGSHGTHGTRYGNFALANADFIMAIGTRLDTKTTATPPKSFARGANIIVVDVDQAEIDKFQHIGLKVEGIRMDAKEYLSQELIKLVQVNCANTDYETAENNLVPKYAKWLAQIADWKRRYPICPPEYYKQKEVNPYVLVKELSKAMSSGDILCCDTGCGVAWLAQAFEFKKGQRFIHAWNQTPMGYGLPASIGAHYATGRRIVCVSGDGSFQMQNELATVAGRHLPIKIIILRNDAHAMCRQTEHEHPKDFGNIEASTSVKTGLTFPPSFMELAWAYNIKANRLYENQQIAYRISRLMKDDLPELLEVMLSPDQAVIPKLHASKPLEDMQPYLSREELSQQMLLGERQSWQNALE